MTDTGSKMGQQLRVYGFVLGLFLAVAGAHSQACYLLNEPDVHGVMKWILPYEDPCECLGKDLRLGGLNARHHARPFTPAAFDPSAVAAASKTKGLKAVLQLLNCHVDESPKCYTFDDVDSSGYRYEFARLPKSDSGGICVNFSVRAREDAHISLVDQNRDEADMYEVVIGGWGDTKSVLRRCKQCNPELTAAENSAGWLDGREYRDFWLKASPGTSGPGGVLNLTLSLGRGHENEAFLSFVDVSPLPFDYVGINMHGAATGSYRFCGLDLKARA